MRDNVNLPLIFTDFKRTYIRLRLIILSKRPYQPVLQIVINERQGEPNENRIDGRDGKHGQTGFKRMLKNSRHRIQITDIT